MIKTIDQIRIIDRKVDNIPNTGPLSGLMWSDPDDYVEDWAQSPRGAGWLFGENATKEFCKINNLSTIVRAHQLCQRGYNIQHSTEISECITIWSAPNYRYTANNDAAIMEIRHEGSNLDRHFKVF